MFERLKAKPIKASIIVQKQEDSYSVQVIPYQEKIFSKNLKPDDLMAVTCKDINTAVDSALKIKSDFELKFKVQTQIIIL